MDKEDLELKTRIIKIIKIFMFLFKFLMLMVKIQYVLDFDKFETTSNRYATRCSIIFY